MCGTRGRGGPARYMSLGRVGEDVGAGGGGWVYSWVMDRWVPT